MTYPSQNKNVQYLQYFTMYKYHGIHGIYKSIYNGLYYYSISLLQLLPAGADGSVEARTANTVAPILFLGHPIGSAHAQL